MWFMMLVKRGAKNPVMITSGDKFQVTVVGCVSAAGYCIPPMIIWDRKTLHPDMAEGELPGTICDLSRENPSYAFLNLLRFNCC